MTKKCVSRRLIFIAIWNNKVSTSLLGEIMVSPCFALRPRVFHWDPCFPPDPVFSTTPRVFHTPGPRTPGPRPRVFHLANHAGKFPHKYTRVAKKTILKQTYPVFQWLIIRQWTSLNLRWLGLGGQMVKNLPWLAYKFDLDQNERKSSQVNESAPKLWLNGARV